MPSAPNIDDFQSGLTRMLGQIAELSVAAGADVQFCAMLQAAVAHKIRGPVEQATGGYVDPAAMQPPNLMGGGQMGPGMGGGQPDQSQAGYGGGMIGLTPSMPNMDEIRRQLAATGKVQ